VLVDLMRIVAAHHLGEVARWGLFEEAGQLSVNIRLHMGLIQARRGRQAGPEGGRWSRQYEAIYSASTGSAGASMFCTGRTNSFLPAVSGGVTNRQQQDEKGPLEVALISKV